MAENSPYATKAAAQIRALRRPDAAPARVRKWDEQRGAHFIEDAPARPAMPSVEEVAEELRPFFCNILGARCTFCKCPKDKAAAAVISLFAKERS